MKTTLVLICLSSLCLINAAPLKRTRQPKSTTSVGFMAKYFHIPEFLKFSQNKTTEPPTNAIQLPQQSRFSRILDSINIFKRNRPFGEPYLRVYVKSNGTYKWYFVYPGEMLYPAPDDFSPDLLSTLPTTPITTTTTTTEPPTKGLDDKPAYPLGKIEFVQNQTEPKENEWAITISNQGPVFQPYVKIKPPYDEPIFQQFLVNDENNQKPQEESEPDEENESVTRKHRKHTRTPTQQPEEPDEDDQPADEPEEQDQDENAEAYDNGEPEEDVPDDENAYQDDDEDAKDDNLAPNNEDVPVTKAAKTQKPSAG